MCFARASERVKERSHSARILISVVAQSYHTYGARTRQSTIKRFLPSMTPHMCPERIPTCMGHALPIAILPFASILLLPSPNVVLVDVLDQSIHIPKVPHRTSFPFTDSNLLVAHGFLVLEQRKPV